MKEIELWADSFHEGHWACEHLYNIHIKKKLKVIKYFENGFIPIYEFYFDKEILKIKVYGSYKSWSPIPKKIEKLLAWGKPDFLAYDANLKKILFAVEETAAVPTGNQALQRCERLYGASRDNIPFWYLLSEFGVHKDGGIRTDSIWPTIMAIKLSIKNITPSIVLHYSDIENPEGYNFGKGVNQLFNALYKLISNFFNEKEIFSETETILSNHYQDMFRFIKSQYKKIIENLPGIDLLNNDEVIKDIINLIIHKKISLSEFGKKYPNFLVWPERKEWLKLTKKTIKSSELIKKDLFARSLELSIDKKQSYIISSNAGSKPQNPKQVADWIKKQKVSFDKAAKLLKIKSNFNVKLSDFPKSDKGNLHLTTSKNILYIFDRYVDIKKIIYTLYPRLDKKLDTYSNHMRAIVYISNSLKPGRIFGDPFTGQISCYSTVFGKFENNPRLVIAYFPHQSFSQFLDTEKKLVENKGYTLMRELVDIIILGGGVVIKFNSDGRAEVV